METYEKLEHALEDLKREVITDYNELKELKMRINRFESDVNTIRSILLNVKLRIETLKNTAIQNTNDFKQRQKYILEKLDAITNDNNY